MKNVLLLLLVPGKKAILSDSEHKILKNSVL